MKTSHKNSKRKISRKNSKRKTSRKNSKKTSHKNSKKTSRKQSKKTSRKQSLELYKFIKESLPYHLTIKDLKNLKVNSTIDVVIFDRNLEEYWIWKNAIVNKDYKPQTFFKGNHCKITKLDEIRWKIKFGNLGESFIHNVELNYTKNSWYPISNNGMIKNKLWTDYPNKTRIGWRGPIMLWKDLKKLPDVYLSD